MQRQLTIPSTSLKQIYNLRNYIQYVVNQIDYNVHDQLNHPLLEDNWIKQTHTNSTKFVIFHSNDTLNYIPISNGELKFVKKS